MQGKQNETSSRTLCAACNQFYGDPSTNNLCSCCYKARVAQLSDPKLSTPGEPAAMISVRPAPVPADHPNSPKEEAKTKVAPRPTIVI